VKNYTFNFEVQTLLEQFVGAFNDIVIKRYDNNRNLTSPTSGIAVDFVYAPKQRVYDTLNTPAPGGLTVPVVAVNINGITRDVNRVFNKNEGFNVNNYNSSDGSLLKKIPQPVPVNIGVSMTIVTKFQSDMDQIISNFVPYCDPYIIISWKLPNPNNPKNPYEIRSEVLWDGNVQLQYPNDIAGNQPYRLTATTNFTIKGWLFKKMDEVVKKIYTIDSKFISNDGTTSENDVVNLTPSIIKDFNTVFGSNQGITVSDFSIQTTSEDIKDFKNTYSTVKTSSGNWEFSYSWIQGNSPSINSAVLYIQSNSGIEIKQQAVTTLVTTNSSHWDIAYSNVPILSSEIQNPIVSFDQVSEVLTVNNSSTSLVSLGYKNIYANSSFLTIQDFAASNPQNLYKGYNITLINNRVYTFAGTDPTNPNHYLEINANPITPIYQEVSLNQNQTLIDSFHLADFKTAKYTLQIETTFSNDIYYSELNVVASILSNTAVVSEYGQISTSNLVLGYNAIVGVNTVDLYLINNIDSNPAHKLIVKGSRTNHYKI
jgi:hypothetical protein